MTGSMPHSSSAHRIVFSVNRILQHRPIRNRFSFFNLFTDMIRPQTTVKYNGRFRFFSLSKPGKQSDYLFFSSCFTP